MRITLVFLIFTMGCLSGIGQNKAFVPCNSSPLQIEKVGFPPEEASISDLLQIAFPDSPARENPELNAIWQISADYFLLSIHDESQLDTLDFSLVQKCGGGKGHCWKGIWQSQMPIASLPEYRWIEPVFAQKDGDTLRMVLSIQDEEDLGILIVSTVVNGSTNEGYVDISALVSEANYWGGACPEAMLQRDDKLIVRFPKATYRYQNGEKPLALVHFPKLEASVANSMLDWKVKEDPKRIKETFIMRKKVQEVVPNMIVLHTNRPWTEKRIAKKGPRIAKKMGLNEFTLFENRAALEIYYLHLEDDVPCDVRWIAGILGSWSNGIWTTGVSPN